MRGRPAESLAGTAGIGVLIAYILGVNDPEIVACLTAGVALVPAAVTLLVDGGGVRGVLRKLWRGNGA